jgi:DNA-binding response OmpR family regulator
MALGPADLSAGVEMPRILVAEDDPMLADGMTKALRDQGHTADAVADGAQALLRLGDRDYDLLVLDLGLPRVPGERVLDALDRAGNDLPVLVVTAADASGTLASRLAERNAAVLRKPFGLVEFEARVRLLVRDETAAAAPVRCGRLTLEASLRRATCGGAALELSEREFDLLHVLVTEPGRLAARSRIGQALAASKAAAGDGAIDVYVHRLRRKLEPHGVRISTVRGIGYVLHDDAAHASARPPEPGTITAEEPPR